MSIKRYTFSKNRGIDDNDALISFVLKQKTGSYLCAQVKSGYRKAKVAAVTARSSQHNCGLHKRIATFSVMQCLYWNGVSKFELLFLQMMPVEKRCLFLSSRDIGYNKRYLGQHLSFFLSCSASKKFFV